MINYREILRLNSLGYSQRQIERGAKCSHHTVTRVIERARQLNLEWPLAEDITDAMLNNILSKPLELTAKVETNNKQAARRLGNALPDERQTWLSFRYLLMKIAEHGYTVSIYLKEKQHAMLDAIEEGDVKVKRQKKAKAPKSSKKKT